MAAKNPLADVHAAARDGSLEFDEASALHKSSPWFETFLELHVFAREVVLSLTDEDWRQSVELGPPHDGWYDVYEKCLDASVMLEHGVPADWYLKLRLSEGLFGDSVFFVSFHEAERPFKKPKGGRS